MSSQPPASADDRPTHDAPPADERTPDQPSATEQPQPPESAEPQAEAPMQPSADTPAQMNPAQMNPAQTSPAETAESAGDKPAGSEAAAPSGESGSESVAAEKSAPRVQLRPSVDPSQTRAIPNVNPGQQSSSGTAAETEVQADADKASAEPSAESRPAPKPAAPAVELPPRINDLDADLEAEIEAAMSGVKLGTSAPRKDDEQEEGVAAPEEAGQLDEETLEPGTRMKGVVQSVHGEDVFVDAGLRSACVIPVRQFGAEPPEEGRTVEFLVSRYDADQGLVVANLPAGREQVGGNWDAVATGQVVDCVVTKSNKGGLEVTVGGLRGFLPAGQVDLHYVGDLEPFVKQKLTVKVLEVNRQRRNIVVSRRALLEEARAEAERTAWQRLEVGQKLTGRVKTIKDYGAFVDLGGVDGFLHIGQISWARIDHPSEVLSEGQEVEVQILTLEPEKKKIGLGMKQLAQSPWAQASNKYATGTATRGKVTRTMDFGAFIELEPGLEGLVHISELDYKRVNRVTDVLQVGQEVDVQVLEVDSQRKRISLSVKALRAKPAAPEEAEEEEPVEEPAAKKPRGPLKGGIGSGGGQLFGNPDDYR